MKNRDLPLCWNYFLYISIKMAPRKNKRGRKNKVKRKQNKPRMLSLGPTYPNSLIAKHTMNYQFDLQQVYNSTTLDSTCLKGFRLNSLYDPDVSVAAGSGHQPRFFDEMAVIYTTYRVIGCKVTLKFINLSNEPVYLHTVVGNQQLSDSTGWTNTTIREVKGCKSQIVHSLNTGPSSIKTMVIGYSPEKVEGKSKAVIRGDPTFEALSSQNPVEQHYLSVGMSQVASALGDNALAKCRCEIKLDFTAIWNDRKIHTQGS